MPAAAKSMPLDFDPDIHARHENSLRLGQVAEAYAHGREVNFPGAQKHMRFSWERASAPLEELVESLYGYFETAASVSIAGGGPHPFDKESVHLSVDIRPVKETTLRDGMGNGLALLGQYLEDPRFQAICTRHDVSEVFTPGNDLKVRTHRVQHHNQPRPL